MGGSHPLWESLGPPEPSHSQALAGPPGKRPTPSRALQAALAPAGALIEKRQPGFLCPTFLPAVPHWQAFLSARLPSAGSLGQVRGLEQDKKPSLALVVWDPRENGCWLLRAPLWLLGGTPGTQRCRAVVEATRGEGPGG